MEKSTDTNGNASPDLQTMPVASETEAQKLTEQPTPKPKYKVNSSAEAILNFFATAELVLGFGGAIIVFLIGVAKLGNYNPYYSDYIGWHLILWALILPIAVLFQWAVLRTLINISRNLFAIRSSLQRDDENASRS